MEIEPVTVPVDLGDDEGDRPLWMSFARKLRLVSGKPKGDIQATIFRVPDTIRTLNADSFEPKIVSLGPYHYGKPRLRASDERIKLPYASIFFRESVGLVDVSNNAVQSIFELFEHRELDARRAYSEEIHMNVDEFVSMMVLDCAFIAEFLSSRLQGHGTEMEERYPWKSATKLIDNDMLIFENQVPLFLLFEVCSKHPSVRGQSLNEFFPVYHFIQDIHQNLSPNSYPVVSDNLFLNNKTIAHLLHLFHWNLVNRLENTASDLGPFVLTSFPSAEKLHAMRIQFAKKTNGKNFLDISFDKSTRIMKIPQLVIDDDNISLLRNLVAFEQQCHGVDNYISAYVWFMDCLINTDKDLAVLRENEIIVSRLRSDEEVARIFNDLRRADAPAVDLDHSYLAEVIHDVKLYSATKYNRLCASWNFSWLKQNYFKNRWVTIVVTLAVFFNLLTLVQTVYAILSYAKQ